jgi:hypothetical protein
LPFAQAPAAQREAYLTWSAAQVESIAKAFTVKGKVEGTRRGLLNTDASKSFKLRATWLTPEVIRATARLIQLRERLSDDQTRALVQEAEAAGDTVVLLEVDPVEGSGVVPVDWGTYLQPAGAAPDSGKAARGVEKSQLREVRALGGVLERDWSYDRFWIAYRLVGDSGQPLFAESDREAELVVRIKNREASLRWAIPDSIRRHLAEIRAREQQAAVPKPPTY